MAASECGMEGGGGKPKRGRERGGRRVGEEQGVGGRNEMARIQCLIQWCVSLILASATITTGSVGVGEEFVFHDGEIKR